MLKLKILFFFAFKKLKFFLLSKLNELDLDKNGSLSLDEFKVFYEKYANYPVSQTKPLVVTVKNFLIN